MGIEAHMMARSISRQESKMERGGHQVKSMYGYVAARLTTML
jgi:hypothetical protein